MVCNSPLKRLAILTVTLGLVGPVQADETQQAGNAAQPALAASESEIAKPPPMPPGMQAKPRPQGTTVGTLGRLFEERLLTNAQVELANAQSKLKTQGVTTAKIAESYAPTVKMVQGVGNNLYATFLYPGNMTMDARVGDTIAGGYKVEAISVSQVVLTKDGEQVRLGFSASPPTPLPSFDAASSNMQSRVGQLSGF